MSDSIATIPLPNLAIAALPLLALIALMFRWSTNAGGAVYAAARMLLQLVLIGYALTWIFSVNSPFLVLGVLTIMLAAASWIALRPISDNRGRLLGASLCAITASGGLTLALITLAVLEADPWYQPQLVIPLAGMIFASSMNAVSIAAERFASETGRGISLIDARNEAFQAALIPLLNSLLAVGLVSLPGMMTGQILSGVDPLIAVRYQIMVMCMLTGAAGIAAAIYLSLVVRSHA